MAAIFYKCLLIFGIACSGKDAHPIFVSVTEIEHNAAAKTLEITCKIFTDDFETALRKQNNTKVDLLDAKLKAAMNPLVNSYIQKHLFVSADDKPAALQFLGYEQQEEGIISYYEVKDVPSIKKISVKDDILYEYKPQQMQIIHVMVNGQRKSSRLDNPESKVSFEF